MTTTAPARPRWLVRCAWAAFLVVGLVRPWGERFRGRRVPVVPVVALGVLGGAAVTAIFDVAMVACYLPILLWGPLTLAATAGYARCRLGHRSRTTSPALAA